MERHSKKQKELGSGSLKKAQGFSVEKYTNELLTIYKRLIQEKENR
jgi:hypothetical protein